MTAHRVYFGKGAQTLTTIPHRAGAPVRVDAGSYQIVDTRYGVDTAEHEVVAAGTATVDALATTLTAAAGREASDRRALTLASTTGGTVGAQYILTAPSGAAELVTVAAVVSATVARVKHEIRGTYPTGSTLRGVEVRATFPAPPAADEDNLDAEAFLVIWTFAGMSPIRESIHLERGEEAQLATLADLVELDPTLARVGGDRIDASAALSRAHKDFRVDLQLAGVSESDLLTGPLGRDAVVYRAAHLALAADDDPAAERRAAAYGARYQELREAITNGAKKPDVVALDKSEQQAQRPNPAANFRYFGWRGPIV